MSQVGQPKTLRVRRNHVHPSTTALPETNMKKLTSSSMFGLVAVPPAPDTSLSGRRGGRMSYVLKTPVAPRWEETILESLAYRGHLGDRVDRRRYGRHLRSRYFRSSSGRDRTPDH